MYMNQLTIIGFTGRDAGFHYTQNGTPVTTNRSLQKNRGRTIRVSGRAASSGTAASFGKLAEYAKTLAKGSHVLIQGALRSRDYEKEGTKHRIVDRAANLNKLDRAVHREEGEPADDQL